MDIFLLTSTWVTLFTLTFLEIILGIDNIIFISIITNKLPAEKQKLARNLGLTLALGIRIALLFGISYIVKLKTPFAVLGPFHIGNMTIEAIDITGRALILFLGGLFLVAKSTSEIFHKMEMQEEEEKNSKANKFGWIILQIILLDIIFSFDSILTAVGLSDQILIMILAVIISMIIMMLFSGKVSKFINDHPSMQILALSFLILIGFLLIMEGVGKEIEKGYVYFAIFFSLLVELINIRLRKRISKKK